MNKQKLTKEQKGALKRFKRDMGDNAAFARSESDGVTVLAVSPFKNSRTIHVSTAVCSPSDKFSKKVGQYNAMMRYYNGEYAIATSWGMSSSEVAWRLVEVL